MEIIKKYSDVARKAQNIITKVLPEQSSELVKESNNLISELESNHRSCLN